MQSTAEETPPSEEGLSGKSGTLVEWFSVCEFVALELRPIAWLLVRASPSWVVLSQKMFDRLTELLR